MPVIPVQRYDFERGHLVYDAIGWWRGRLRDPQNAARLTLNTAYSLGLNHLRAIEKLVAILLAQVYATPLKEPLIKT